MQNWRAVLYRRDMNKDEATVEGPHLRVDELRKCARASKVVGLCGATPSDISRLCKDIDRCAYLQQWKTRSSLSACCTTVTMYDLVHRIGRNRFSQDAGPCRAALLDSVPKRQQRQRSNGRSWVWFRSCCATASERMLDVQVGGLSLDTRRSITRIRSMVGFAARSIFQVFLVRCCSAKAMLSCERSK